jgi:hypothetical protein
MVLCNIVSEDDSTIYVQSSVCTVESLQNNHLEADTLVWLHATKCVSKNVVIYSPDNDVYHVGFTVINKYPHKNFIVQLKITASPSKYLHLNKLIEEMLKNKDLKHLGKDKIGSVFQTLFFYMLRL